MASWRVAAVVGCPEGRPVVRCLGGWDGASLPLRELGSRPSGPGIEFVPELVVAATLESVAPKNRVKEANRRMRVARHPPSEEHESFPAASFEPGCARR